MAFRLLRPSSTASSSLPILLIRHASTSTAPAPSTSTPPPTLQTKRAPTHPPRTRPFPATKTRLFTSYLSLFSSSPISILVRHDNFTVSELNAIRSLFNDLPASHSASLGSESDAATAAAKLHPEDVPFQRPKLTVLRTGLLKPVLRTLRLDDQIPREYTTGPLALVTLPELSPPTLKATLAVLLRASNTPYSRPPPGSAAATSKPKKGAPVEAVTRLPLLTAIVDEKVMKIEGLKEFSELPGRDELFGMVVGLLEGTGRGIVRVLSQAAGEDVLRTMKGLEEGLKEAEGGAEGAAEVKA